MLYSKDKVFDEYKDFFKYQPNLFSRHLLYYYEENEFLKIWDYEFNTNNFGLVQKTDIFPNRDSILFLGDSFTEGQGAEPWIDDLGKNIYGHQIVNGGFGGAGPKQFIYLNDYLSKKLNIKKRVILFISSDIRRGIVQLDNTACIIDHKRCSKKNNAYGIPNNKDFNIEDFLSKFVFDQKLSTKKKNKIHYKRFVHIPILKDNY